MAQVSVLIPAYNEENRIARTIAEARRIPEVAQVLVVDDGSVDATRQKALSAGAEVVRLENNMGKGHALNAGAQMVRGDIVLLLDADLGDSAREGEKLVRPVAEGSVDMTIAAISASKGSGGFGLVKGLAKHGVRVLTGEEISCALSGQRAMRRPVFETLLPFAPGFGVEVAMTVKALQHGYKVGEVPTLMRHNETGKNLAGFVHRGRQFVDIAAALARSYFGGGRGWRWSSHY